MESALQSNETINIFDNEFNLGDDDQGTSKLTTQINDVVSFLNTDYIQNTMISNIQWMPGTNNTVAMACFDNYTFEERVFDSGKAKD